MAYGDGASGSAGGYGSGASGGAWGFQSGTDDEKKKDDGGVLATLSHVLHQSPADLRDMALGVPGGFMAIHNALAAADPTNLRHFGHSDTSQLGALGKSYVKAIKTEARHPLRNPGNTFVDIVLPFLTVGASAALRVGSVAGVAGEAGTTGQLAKAALRNPSTGRVRTITAPSGATARGHYSRAAGALVTQKAADALLQKGAAKGGRLGKFAENRVDARIDKWTKRQLRVEQAQLDAKVTRLAVATAKLTPVQSRALRFAFEKVPLAERLAADTQRTQEAAGRVNNKPGADSRTVKRLQEREQWGKDAVQHLDVDADGIPSMKLDTPEGEHLGGILDLMGQVYGDRVTILKALKIMDDEALQAAQHKVGRYAAGAKYVEPTDARLGRGRSVVSQRRYVEQLTKKFDALYATEKPGSPITRDRKLNRAEAIQHLAELNLTHDIALKRIAEAKHGPADMGEVRYRNQENARARRQASGKTRSGKWSGASGRKSVLRPTIWDERYAEAQQMINDQIAKNPEHPVMQRWAERQDEIQRLEELLTPDIEDLFGSGGPSRAVRNRLDELEREAERAATRVESLQAQIAGDVPRTHAPGVAERQLPPAVKQADAAATKLDTFKEKIEAGTAEAREKPITVTEGTLAGRSTRLERLGGALSWEKEKLERAEKGAARYVEPTGAVGAENLWRNAAGDVEIPEGAGFIGYPRRATVRQPKVKVSSGGTIGHTRDPAFMVSKGETIRYGLDDPNVGKVLAARGMAANKLKMLQRRVDIARKGGTKIPTRDDDVFVWNDGELLSQNRIPDDVKDFLSDPEKYADNPAETRSRIDALRGAWLKPDWKLDPEMAKYLEAAAQGKGVFVHRRVLGDIGKPLPSRLEGKLGTVADTTNNIQKSLLIYLKANYVVVQALSNTAMNFIQQGPAAPVNIARAIHLTRDDPELAGVVDDVMGTGALMQLAGESAGTNKLARGSAAMTQRLAHFMGNKVDGPARRSAFLHEADKAGFKTRAQLKSLIEDPENAEQLGEVAQRAKEAIVDYGEMSASEQALIRRIFFVYPWLKGSTKYAGHFLRDHPIQASVLSQVAQEGNRQNADLAKGLPSYLRGSFLSGPGGGLVNPSGVNPLQTPVSIIDTLIGATRGDVTAPEGAQFLTPAIATALAIASKRNTLGIPLKGNIAAQLRQILLDPTFAAQLARAGARTAGADVNAKDELTNPLLANVLGPRTASKSFPNPNDPYWRFFWGGLYPRDYDEGALRRAKALQESGR